MQDQESPDGTTTVKFDSLEILVWIRHFGLRSITLVAWGLLFLYIYIQLL